MSTFSDLFIDSGAADSQLNIFSVDCVFRPQSGGATNRRCKLVTAPPSVLSEDSRMVATRLTIVVSDDEWDVDAIDTGGDKVSINGIDYAVVRKPRQRQSGMTTLELASA